MNWVIPSCRSDVTERDIKLKLIRPIIDLLERNTMVVGHSLTYFSACGTSKYVDPSLQDSFTTALMLRQSPRCNTIIYLGRIGWRRLPDLGKRFLWKMLKYHYKRIREFHWAEDNVSLRAWLGAEREDGITCPPETGQRISSHRKAIIQRLWFDSQSLPFLRHPT